MRGSTGLGATPRSNVKTNELKERQPAVTSETTTQRSEKRSKRRGAVLLSLALGAALSAVVALAGTAPEAKAAFTEKIVFSSNRTTGTGVNNPTGDYEVFKMNPDGTGIRQLTFNAVDEEYPTLSPDGKKIAYASKGVQPSNPQGDDEIYLMNALDGTAKKNLTDNGADVYDTYPHFSPDGKRIAYESEGIQTSNPEGDNEVYRMNALDGTGKKNLSNTDSSVRDYYGDFSPDSTKVAYQSEGVQTTNPEGDVEVYRVNALDGTGKKNLTDNGDGVNDFRPQFSPGGKRIGYDSNGTQTSNPEGDNDVYVMSSLDGSGKKNLTNNGAGVYDTHPQFSPDGKKIAFLGGGIRTSNPQGDNEVYVMSSLDGSGKKNLTNNGANDFNPDWGVQAT
jgi:Tol biopolymer transport system component